MKKIFGLIILVMLSFVSCKKTNSSKLLDDELNKPPSLSYDIDSLERVVLLEDTVLLDRLKITYYFDEIDTFLESDDSILSNPSDYFPVYSATKNIVDSSAEIAVYIFSSFEKYSDFGDRKGYNLRETHLFETKVNILAQRHNLYQYDNSELPQVFLDSIELFYNQILKLTPPPLIFAGMLTFYDDFIPYGTQITNPNALIVGLGNWNDRIGCYKTFSLYSVVNLFDKTFFRKKIATVAS